MEQEYVEKPRGIIRKIFGAIFKILIVLILLVGVGFVLKIAPNYVRNEITDKVNLVINFSNVTNKTKQEMLVEDEVVYLSLEDIKNYYDDNIYYDEQYNLVVTSSENKLAVLEIGENKMTVNGKERKIKGEAKVENDVYYVPISEMEDVYNIDVKRVDNKVVIESLDKELTTCVADKDINIKYKTEIFSKTIEKIEEGQKLAIADTEKNNLPEGWIRVRSENGNIGYVEEKDIRDIKIEREETTYEKTKEGNISLVWDYFSKYGKAPDNTDIKYDGVNVVSPSFFYLELENTEKEQLTRSDVEEQAKFIENVGEEGIKYIEWAKNNGYEVWPKFSNETLPTTIDEFSIIINDYELREKLIKEILSYVKKYNLDGVNLDFEYMYQGDNEAFSKFIIELAPQLRDQGVCLSVDVTAPYGGERWSLCYDRHLIGEVADYVVFMGYDQYGTSVMGTTSGFNWVKKNINNFLNIEDVPSEKLILALPFYTRLWKTTDGENVEKAEVVYMKNIDEVIPENATREWLEELEQYFVQYEENGYIYKMWIEDKESFSKKIELVDEYNLAGAAYWTKGFEPEDIWRIIKESLNI